MEYTIQTQMSLQEWMECGVCNHMNACSYEIVCKNGHSFCTTCALKITGHCPMCRSERIVPGVADLSRKNIISMLQQQFMRTLQVGIDVDARDCDDHWYAARVVEAREDFLLIHFYGWSDRWDEWIHDHERIAPLHTYTTDWLKGIKLGEQIEFRTDDRDDKKPVWYRGEIAHMEKGFVYVGHKRLGCTFRAEISRECLAPVGTHTLVYKRMRHARS